MRLTAQNVKEVREEGEEHDIAVCHFTKTPQQANVFKDVAVWRDKYMRCSGVVLTE